MKVLYVGIVSILLLFMAKGETSNPVQLPPPPGYESKYRTYWKPESLDKIDWKLDIDGPRTGLSLVPVLCIDFPDRQWSISLEDLSAKLLDAQQFIKFQSYTHAEVYYWTCFGGVVRMPHPTSYYFHDNHGYDNYPRNIQGIVEFALEAIDGGSQADFSIFDNSLDGVVDALLVVVEGDPVSQGANTVWPHSWELPARPVTDGVVHEHYHTVNTGHIYLQGELPGIGEIVHELLHDLWGMYDLYGWSAESGYGVGKYSVMSQGVWMGDGNTPAFLDPWHKMEMGWISPRWLLEDAQVTVAPYSTGDSVAIALNEFEFLLGINVMPYEPFFGEGLVFYHIDRRALGQFRTGEGTNPCEWDQTYGIAVEQSDGEYHLELGTLYNDDSVPFPGRYNITEFTVQGAPNTMDNDCIVEMFDVTDIHRDITGNMVFTFNTNLDYRSYLTIVFD